jgi:hypothetical protein
MTKPRLVPWNHSQAHLICLDSPFKHLAWDIFPFLVIFRPKEEESWK